MSKHWFGRTASLALGAFLAMSAYGQTTDRITIDGSTGVMPLAASLAKAFQAQNPGVTIEMGRGLGTGARLQALAEGKIDIALASHGLNVNEIARQGLAAHEVARMAVVFGVNETVSASDLTDQQICEVYAGKTSTWKALGGPELKIAPRTRPDTEVDAEVVRAGIKCLAELRMPETVKVMPRSGEMANELAVTAGAIGMTTMTVVEQSQGKIKALSINGIAPSSQNVERQVYPLVRQSFFVIKAAPPPAVARFLAFTRSPAGDDVIRANGAIPTK